MSVYAAQEGAKEEVAAVKPAGEAAAEKAVSLVTEMDKVSYIIGTQIAGNLKKAEIEVNPESLMHGLKDALAGTNLAMSQAEMTKIYTGWQQRMRAEQAAKQKKEAAENLAKGTAFLEANKTKEGVKVLPSGLQYKVIKEGTGNTPVATDTVKTHYRGRLLDGTEFDSSYKGGQPAKFPVARVIAGWTEALQLMKEGAKWELYIPANLAYKERGSPPKIPPNSTLIFDIELIEVVKPAEPAEVVK
jgi:FKBP-type peptidyl-prolyl cis-trans isomerase FklB